MALRKLRFVHPNHHLVYNLSLTLVAFILGLASVMIVFEIVFFRSFVFMFPGSENSVRNPTQNVVQDQLHGSASISPAALSSSVAGSPGEVTMTVKPSGGYAYLGQKDVSFLELELHSSKFTRIEKLTVSLDGFARPSDLKSVQLYFDGKFVSDVLFFEGKGQFENLKLQLDPNASSKLEIKGWVNYEAFSGDRIKLGIMGDSDIVIRNENLETSGVQGAFPLQGGAVSVVGNRM